jgi:hypothetical protein
MPFSIHWIYNQILKVWRAKRFSLFLEALSPNQNHLLLGYLLVHRFFDLPRHRRHNLAFGYLKQNPGKLLELATLLGHESLDTTAICSLPSEEDLAAEVKRSSYNIDA